MRDIIFRGKRVDNGEWVEGYVSEHTICGDETYIATVIEKKPEKIYDCESYIVIPETIGQHIWLNDVHHKKVFLDDIILVGGKDECIVKLYKGRYFAESIRTKAKYSWNELAFGRYTEFEIWGNIHDNPKL